MGCGYRGSIRSGHFLGQFAGHIQIIPTGNQPIFDADEILAKDTLRSFGRVSRFQHLLPATQWSPNFSTRELAEARSVAPFVLAKSAKWQRRAIRRVMLCPAYFWACIHSTYCSICGANQFERTRSTVVGLRKYCSSMTTSIQNFDWETHHASNQSGYVAIESGRCQPCHPALTIRAHKTKLEPHTRAHAKELNAAQFGKRFSE